LQEIIGQELTLRISQALPGTAAAVVKVVRAAGLEGVMAKRNGFDLPPPVSDPTIG